MQHTFTNHQKGEDAAKTRQRKGNINSQDKYMEHFNIPGNQMQIKNVFLPLKFINFKRISKPTTHKLRRNKQSDVFFYW